MLMAAGHASDAPGAASALWLGYLAGTILCVAFAAVAATQVWPPMDGDSAMLFPAAVELARGNGFVNTPWIPPLNDSIDGPGGRRYISHGFLNPLLVGLAARATGGDAPAAVAWLYVVVAVAALLSAFAMIVWWRDAVSAGRFIQLAVGFLAVVAMFAIAFKWFGRMESLAMIWVSLAILAWRFLHGWPMFGVCGACVGLLAFTSPVCGVVGLLILLVAMLLGRQPLTIHRLIALGAGGVFAAAASLLIYPYPLRDWIGGTIRHSRIHFDHPSFQGFAATWLASPHFPLMIVSLGLLAALATPPVVRLIRDAPIWRRVVAGAGLGLIAFVMFRLIFVRSEAAYNAVPWFPLLGALSMVGLKRRPAVAALLLALLLPAAGLFRSASLLASQTGSGSTYAEVRNVISQHVGEGLLVSNGLWLAVPDLAMVEYGRPWPGQPGPRWFLDQQLASGKSAPPSYPGYRLVTDRFSPGVKLLGFPLSRTPTGWQYALYERTNAP